MKFTHISNVSYLHAYKNKDLFYYKMTRASQPGSITRCCGNISWCQYQDHYDNRDNTTTIKYITPDLDIVRCDNSTVMIGSELVNVTPERGCCVSWGVRKQYSGCIILLGDNRFICTAHHISFNDFKKLHFGN